MIGVLTAAHELDAAVEFFELFKTPWELAVPGQDYTALVSSVDTDTRRYRADVVIAYGSDVRDGDSCSGATRVSGETTLSWGSTAIPIYGGVQAFATPSLVGVTCGARAIDCERSVDGQTVHRVGYDLFGEVRRLLTAGQPADRSLSPTLELHAALLRSLLVRAGVSFVEVPPRPHGFDFTCCLTHDVDFCGIRRHAADLTLLGFIYRATIGTAVDFVRGRRTWDETLANWKAFATLPLVFARLLPDPWRPFDDYAAAEPADRSTFFVVPFKGRPGTGPDGRVARRRAVAYQASDVAADLNQAQQNGSEIALHGLDAWRDTPQGVRERAEITRASGQPPAGVRMHWLYFDRNSPARLEAAGFTYDSTWGYNDAVGYRAGTSQVFRLLDSRTLFELPLAIMDTALLFRDRMNLGSNEAMGLVRAVVDQARRFGGTVVINWHDRSLAPERLWNRSYRAVLSEVSAGNRVWFATAAQAVEWYRWRRSIRFVRQVDSTWVAISAARRDSTLPAAVLKRYDATLDGVTINEEPLDGVPAVPVSAPSMLADFA